MLLLLYLQFYSTLHLLSIKKYSFSIACNRKTTGKQFLYQQAEIKQL